MSIQKPAVAGLTLIFLAAALGSLTVAEAGKPGPRPGKALLPGKGARAPHPYLGNPNAKVVIVVYGDLQCPYTARLLPTLPRIVRKYPRKVKVVWRDFPISFHRRAMPAAVVAREVYRQRGVKAFMRIVKRIISNRSRLTDSNLLAWAVSAGANRAKVLAAIRSGVHRVAILREMKVATRRGVRGTPTILINGTPHKGGRRLSDFQRVIDAL